MSRTCFESRITGDGVALSRRGADEVGRPNCRLKNDMGMSTTVLLRVIVIFLLSYIYYVLVSFESEKVYHIYLKFPTIVESDCSG